MRRLTVLYDDRCAFCRRCRAWLERRRQLVALEFVPARAADVARLFPGLSVAAGEELVVVSDEGGVYRDADAFVICLWATEEGRAWSHRLSSPEWRPLARGFFKQVSSQRHAMSRFIGWWTGEAGDADCEEGCPRP